jgi:alkaline phosphatase D
MLFIGDNHYGNASELGDLRQFYRHAHTRPLRADLMSRTATIATWDDHDYVGNNTDGTAPGKDIALRVFQEYWANGSYGADGVAGVFSVQHMADVDIFLLDDRYWRGLDDSILGDAQEAWLMDALGASTATFKVLASGSQWTPDGSSDSWGAYPAAWDRFRQSLVDGGVEGVVLLSGDIHSSELRLLDGGPGGYDLPELTSSPLATWNGTCGNEADVLACVNDGAFFMTVDFDTTLPDPSLTATIVDVAGAARAEWTILRSELAVGR